MGELDDVGWLQLFSFFLLSCFSLGCPFVVRVSETDEALVCSACVYE